MPSAYDGLYAWMYAVFRDRTFTATDFRETFPSPAPAKVLADFRVLGYLSSEARGTYKVVPPEERVRRIVERADRMFGLAERAGLPYAYSRDTAVAIWTDFTYWTGFTQGFRPLHMDAASKDIPRWKEFFAAERAPATVEGSRETLFGAVHVLHPVAVVRSVRRGGVRVVPPAIAYAYAAARPYAYEPVLAGLRRKARGGAR